ncbi:glycerate kinase [Kineococcus sp. SYSU DK002]|uniref:glycerate kinase n=1 Tax=Kineococcus sp. SYSU DK002 TaxID=3383123 RepID=UPI003D7CE61E
MSPHALCASDKFRGTATVPQIGAGLARAAAGAGWTSRTFPVSDGGEGFLEAMGGRPVPARVTGPLGEPVEATWHLSVDGRTAVVEVAQAAGLLLAGGASGNDPVAATTRGVGEQVLDAVRHGARRVVVGCGGSATTDGGSGMVRAVLDAGGLPPGTELVAATDVSTPYLRAAAVFAPQKGADPATVDLLTSRLRQTAQLYLSVFGVDVRTVPGAGAAGGLAGGIVALGGRVEAGFDVVARTNGFDAAAAGADVVVTGEGRLDATSLAGKVVGQVLDRVDPGTPVHVVVGSADPATRRQLLRRERAVELTVLADRYGLEAAMTRTLDLLQQVFSDRFSPQRVDSLPG